MDIYKAPNPQIETKESNNIDSEPKPLMNPRTEKNEEPSREHELPSVLMLIRNYMESTTMHGISYIVDSTPFLIRRYFASHPIAVSVTVNRNDSVRFPLVTICNPNMCQITNSYKEKWIDFFSNVDRGPEISGMSNLSKVYEGCRQDINDLISGCKWKGELCDVDDFYPIVTSAYGVCYTFKPFVNSHNGSLDMTQPGLYSGLRIVANVESYEYISGNYEGASGLININLPPPHWNCSERPLALFKHYTHGKCMEECFINYIVKRFNCVPRPLINNEYTRPESEWPEFNRPDCDGYKVLAIKKAKGEFYKVVRNSACKCPDSCKKHTYDITTSQSSIGDSVFDLFNKKGTAKLGRQYLPKYKEATLMKTMLTDQRLGIEARRLQDLRRKMNSLSYDLVRIKQNLFDKELKTAILGLTGGDQGRVQFGRCVDEVLRITENEFAQNLTLISHHAKVIADIMSRLVATYENYTPERGDGHIEYLTSGLNDLFDEISKAIEAGDSYYTTEIFGDVMSNAEPQRTQRHQFRRSLNETALFVNSLNFTDSSRRILDTSKLRQLDFEFRTKAVPMAKSGYGYFIDHWEYVKSTHSNLTAKLSASETIFRKGPVSWNVPGVRNNELSRLDPFIIELKEKWMQLQDEFFDDVSMTTDVRVKIFKAIGQDVSRVKSFLATVKNDYKRLEQITETILNDVAAIYRLAIATVFPPFNGTTKSATYLQHDVGKYGIYQKYRLLWTTPMNWTGMTSDRAYMRDLFDDYLVVQFSEKYLSSREQRVDYEQSVFDLIYQQLEGYRSDTLLHLYDLRDTIQKFLLEIDLDRYDRHMFIRNNMILLNMYFKELSYRKIEQYPDYGMFSFLGEVGGYMGLLLGASIFTLFEIVDLILHNVAKSIYFRHCRRENRNDRR
ncbi:uncharacterized protein LOC141909180 [Tubulanus polymorphus]|uniref:uncharacterized protein LOC141909180 n=1 Tax=Tubulanus polymorphus TaxID=672921 RepID=UPI003DA5CB0F